MSKLLSLIVAAMFAAVSVNAVAQAKKDDKAMMEKKESKGEKKGAEKGKKEMKKGEDKKKTEAKKDEAKK